MRLIMGLTLACVLSSHPGFSDPKPAPPAAAKPPPAPKPVKQETRAELEAEVEQLRAENLALRDQVAKMTANDEARRKRLRDQVGEPTTTLK